MKLRSVVVRSGRVEAGPAVESAEAQTGLDLRLKAGDGLAGTVSGEEDADGGTVRVSGGAAAGSGEPGEIALAGTVNVDGPVIVAAPHYVECREIAGPSGTPGQPAATALSIRGGDADGDGIGHNGADVEIMAGQGGGSGGRNGNVTVDGYRYLKLNLPTSDPGEDGALWNDAGTVKVSGMGGS